MRRKYVNFFAKGRFDGIKTEEKWRLRLSRWRWALNFFEIPRDWFEPYNYARKKTGLVPGDFTMNAFAQIQPPLMQIRS